MNQHSLRHLVYATLLAALVTPRASGAAKPPLRLTASSESSSHLMVSRSMFRHLRAWSTWLSSGLSRPINRFRPI